MLAFNKANVAQILSLPECLDPVLVVALGRPAERCVITDVVDGDIRYYRDEAGVHFVPKRSMDELVI